MNRFVLRMIFGISLMSFLILMSSCDNSDYDTNNSNIDIVLETSSSIDCDSVLKVSRSLNLMFENGYASRASLQTTFNTNLVLAPLVPSGQLIRNELLEQTGSNGNIICSSEEIEMLKNMTDEELAAFAYCIATTESAGRGANITFDDVKECLLDATGFPTLMRCTPSTYVKGVRMAMTAKTALQIAKCVCVRYMGAIGTMYMMYSFAECINSKTK